MCAHIEASLVHTTHKTMFESSWFHYSTGILFGGLGGFINAVSVSPSIGSQLNGCVWRLRNIALYNHIVVSSYAAAAGRWCWCCCLREISFGLDGMKKVRSGVGYVWSHNLSTDNIYKCTRHRVAHRERYDNIHTISHNLHWFCVPMFCYFFLFIRSVRFGNISISIQWNQIIVLMIVLKERNEREKETKNIMLKKNKIHRKSLN